MMSKLIYGRMASSLKAALWQSYAIDLAIEFVPDKSVSLERLNVVQRRALLRAVWRLLQNWPDNFIEFCRANKLASHCLIGDTKRLPFWYCRVVREHLTKSARKNSAVWSLAASISRIIRAAEKDQAPFNCLQETSRRTAARLFPVHHWPNKSSDGGHIDGSAEQDSAICFLWSKFFGDRDRVDPERSFGFPQSEPH